MGVGKPLKSILHMNPDIPIFLGTGMESTKRLTAELADGWLPLGYVPETADTYEPWINTGLDKAGKPKEAFEVQAMTNVIVTDDVRSALDRLKPGIALYVGGMGHKDTNFHKEMMIRRGFPEAAERIQELFLAGKKTEAIEAVPDEYVDQGALVGPKARITDRFRAWQDLGVDGLTLHTEREDAIELMADLAGCRP